MKLFLVSIVRMLLASALVLSSQAAVPARAAEDTKSRPTAKPESKAATSNNCDEIDSVLRELISSRQMNGNQRIIGAITSGFPVLSKSVISYELVISISAMGRHRARMNRSKAI